MHLCEHKGWSSCVHNCVHVCTYVHVYKQLYTHVYIHTRVYVHVYEQLYRARPAVVACATDCWALGSRAPRRIRHPQAPQAGSLNIARASTTSNSIALHIYCIYSAYMCIYCIGRYICTYAVYAHVLSLQFLWTSCIKTCVW